MNAMSRVTRRLVMRAGIALLATGVSPLAEVRLRGSVRQSREATRLAAALREAVAGVLDVPESLPDGTPRDGRAEAPWLRVPASVPDEAAVSIVANPLHPGQRARALEAERQIQQAARASQDASQRDYDRAVDAFSRGLPTPDRLREISLDDEGVAGERYDAESELIVQATWQEGPLVLTRQGPSAPGPVASLGRPWVCVAAASGEYGRPARYAPTELWVGVGVSAAPSIRALSDTTFELTLGPSPNGPWVLLQAQGDRALIETLIADAPWMPLVRVLPGR